MLRVHGLDSLQSLFNKCYSEDVYNLCSDIRQKNETCSNFREINLQLLQRKEHFEQNFVSKQRRMEEHCEKKVRIRA